MKKELNHFYIGKSYGGNQDWFWDFMMHLGGCAAVTACDSCIYFAREKGWKDIYPFDANNLTRRDYVNFSKIMKPYLRPRRGGVDKPELYVEGFKEYLAQRGIEGLSMDILDGTGSEADAWDAVVRQIDRGFLIPCLILHHQNPDMDDYVWHWFLLAGYELEGEEKRVQAVTYGEGQWLNFSDLWNTGMEPKGGLILYNDCSNNL